MRSPSTSSGYESARRRISNIKLTKDGVTVSQVLSLYVDASPRQPLTVAGPAKIKLWTNTSSNSYSVTAFATFEVCPESFPPGLTLILPEGTIGIVHVESSTNLVSWQDEWVNTCSNTNQNRFFRIRADRIVQ